MAVLLNRLSKGEPDWHLPLNANANTIEAAFENFSGGVGDGFQEQLDDVRHIAESRFPEVYETGIGIDTLTDAGAYGVQSPVMDLPGDDVGLLTLRGGGDTADKLHQVAFPFDGASPSMHTRTLLDGAWTPWRLRASGATLLWSGSWNSGQITIPNFASYCGFILTLTGQGTTIPVYRAPGSGHMRGVNGYSSATPTIVTYHFTATVSGETLTFVACNNLSHAPSGSHGAAVNNTISGIYGVVLA